MNKYIFNIVAKKDQTPALFNERQFFLRKQVGWKRHFKNRLSDAMVLIEAEEKGGSISAGRTCLAMHRPLFAPIYEGMPASATGNRILLGNGALGLTKNRKTNRANLMPVEDILFKREETFVSYRQDIRPDKEQLALFENTTDYGKSKD